MPQKLQEVLVSPYFKWHSRVLAAKITELAREGLTLLIGKVKKLGYPVIYYDTDSLIIKAIFDDCERLSKNLTIELEACFKTKYGIRKSYLRLELAYLKSILFF
jgi:hypothetical protein